MNTAVSLSQGNKGCSKQCSTCGCGPRASDKWIPWYFVLFFVVITSVLGFFAYLAVSTEPGVVTSDAYQKGLNYDQIIAESNAGQDIPWTIHVRTQKQQGQVNLQITLSDNAHNSVPNAEIQAWWIRPAQDGQDQHWTLKYDGTTYSATGQLPLDGAWDVHVTASDGMHQKQFVQSVVVE